MKTSNLLLVSCMCLTLPSCVIRPHRSYTHPGVSGTVSDQKTGLPGSGASVGFHGRSERSITDSSGNYSLDPVSRFSIVVPLGDPYFASTVEARADGYRTKKVEIGHGAGGVYGSRLNIRLQAGQRGGGN